MNRLAKFLRDYSLARFLLPAGIMLIVFGAVLFSIKSKQIGYKQTEATISRVELLEDEYYDGETHHDATYSVYVKYTVDGKEYEEEAGNFPKLTVGDPMTILYNPTNPKEISQKVGVFVPIAIIVTGAVALIITIISIIRTRKKNVALKKQEEEWTNGR